MQIRYRANLIYLGYCIKFDCSHDERDVSQTAWELTTQAWHSVWNKCMHGTACSHQVEPRTQAFHGEMYVCM